MKPTKEQILEKYFYDGASLRFACDSGRWGKYKAGSVAGSINKQGIVMTCLHGRYYQEHQLIWVLNTGEWPARPIRHVNGILHDNRIENLSMDSMARGKVDKELTVDRLREMLSYDPETGVFRWKVSPRNRTLPGDIAGYINDGGYVLCIVDQQRVRLHRAAWAITNGEWPAGQIDHINGIRNDNRMCNLRIASASQNMQNTSLRSDNSTGVKGVHFRADTGKYQSRINVDGKTLYLGCFDAIEDAKNARIEAEVKLHPYRAIGR